MPVPVGVIVGERHPFLEKLLVLERDAHTDGVGLQAFDEFVHTPGVAEQLSRLVESGSEFEAQSSARLLRFLRPCPARTVILRRVAALPPVRRVRLGEMLLQAEKDAYEPLLAEAHGILEARNDALLLLAGDKHWLQRRGPYPLSRISEKGLESIDQQRRAAGVGVVTTFGHLLPLRLRKPVRAVLQALLGRQPGEPAARALQRELSKATGVEETRRIRREVMRQGSLVLPAEDGGWAVEGWGASERSFSFRLTHTPVGREAVVLDGTVAASGMVRSLRAVDLAHRPQATFEDVRFRLDPREFHGFVRRVTHGVTHETEVLVERTLGLRDVPFVLPKPAGRTGAKELRAFMKAGLLGSPPDLWRPREDTLRSAWRSPAIRRELVGWLQLGAALSTLAGRGEEAAAMLAEAAFVSSGRRSEVYDLAATVSRERRDLDSPSRTGPRLVPDPA